MVEWHKVHVLCNVHVCWENRLGSTARCAGRKCLLLCVFRAVGVLLFVSSSFGRAWCLVDVSFGVSSVVALCLCGLCMVAVMEHKMAMWAAWVFSLLLLRCEDRNG